MNMGGRHLSSSRLKSCNSNLLRNPEEKKKKKMPTEYRDDMLSVLDGKNLNGAPTAPNEYCAMLGIFEKESVSLRVTC